MQTKAFFRRTHSAALLLALVLALLGLGVRPARAAGPITTTACTPAGTGAVTCELWAATGSLSLPDGSSVPFLGYASTDPGLGGIPTLPGPALIAAQGDVVTVILHNSLTAATSLKLSGQGLVPDRTGAAPGGSQTYVFTASQPGTFLYEAGPLPGAQYQTAMGLHGALVVRSTIAGQAFGSAGSAYDDEVQVVLSEIDPLLNNSAVPANFDMRRFKAKYWLINGKGYPQTDVIDTQAGNRVLLRYANAGQQPHTMAILGMDQVFLSLGGVELINYRTSASQQLMPGEAADAIASVPASAVAGARFPFYEAGLVLSNNGSQAFGGMLAFLEVGGTPGTGDVLGPAASGLALAPNPTNGTLDVSLSATVSDAGRGDANILAAEYFIGAPGPDGSGAAMSGAFAGVTENVSAVILASDLALLSGGNYTIYVHGQDANLNWGSFNTIVLNLDTVGPTTQAIVLAPAVTSGSANVLIQATGNDSATGGGNIAQAEYFIDAIGADGSGAAMTINTAAPIASLNGSIPVVMLQTLSSGAHTVYVHASDSQGNWGATASATLTLDRSGPTASNVRTNPPATNGASSVRVDATLTDLSANISLAELFIDTVGNPGTGLRLYATDGRFNSLSENVYGMLSQAQMNALAAGAHTVYVRGRDATGSWGPTGSYTLISDKVRPVVTGLSASPNPTNGTTDNNTSFTLSASAGDAAPANSANIILAEWYENPTTTAGRGNQFSFAPAQTVSLNAVINFTALNWTPGNHTIYVRAKDAANNWSVAVSVVVNVVYPNAVFTDGFESGSFSAWSATGGTVAQISVTSGAAQQGASKMSAAISGGLSGFVQDNTPVADMSYNTRFYLNPNNASFTTNAAATTPRTIFTALSAANQTVFQIQLRRTSTTGTFEVRVVISRLGGTTATGWFAINNNAYNAIEVNWSSAASSTFSLYTGGVLRQSVAGLNTSALRVDSVRLGPQGTLMNMTGTLFFDNFVSTRRTVIGL